MKAAGPTKVNNLRAPVRAPSPVCSKPRRQPCGLLSYPHRLETEFSRSPDCHTDDFKDQSVSFSFPSLSFLKTKYVSQQEKTGDQIPVLQVLV